MRRRSQRRRFVGNPRRTACPSERSVRRMSGAALKAQFPAAWKKKYLWFTVISHFKLSNVFWESECSLYHHKWQVPTLVTAPLVGVYMAVLRFILLSQASPRSAMNGSSRGRAGGPAGRVVRFLTFPLLSRLFKVMQSELFELKNNFKFLPNWRLFWFLGKTSQLIIKKVAYY